MGVMTACRNFVRTGAFRPYADGQHLTHRRLQKYRILHELLEDALPETGQGRLADFGCADGAIPVRLLESDLGARISEYVGVTLFNYTENAAEESYSHPRFRRVVADLEEPIADAVPEDQHEQFDVVTATAFLHYLKKPEAALDNAAWLLREGGALIISIPARWVLKFRLNPITTLGNPVFETQQVRTRQSWEEMFRGKGWSIERVFTTQFTGLPFPFTVVDKTYEVATRGVLGANMFFCLRRR